MLIELGNHTVHERLHPYNGAPKVTTVHIPEADDRGLGGYTHKPGAISPRELKDHWFQSMLEAGADQHPITHLPDHEIALSVVNAWPEHGRGKPEWIRVRSHEEIHGQLPDPGFAEDGTPHPKIDPHPPEIAADIEAFLKEFWELPENSGKPPDLEDRYWTRWGPPGDGPRLPEAQALYLNDGRVISNINDGGGAVGVTGQATAATATSLTTALNLTSNQYVGYRVYATVSATAMVFGNITAVSAGPNSVITVDRWYAVATPGGAAGSTPSATATFIIPDGGIVSTWFVGLTTTNITPAATDHTLSGEYTVAGGGMIRKIAPYTQTSGVASRAFTLTPVYTVNGSDTAGALTFYAIIVSASMVPAASGVSKFETSLNASATTNTVGDQITVTETVTGS